MMQLMRKVATATDVTRTAMIALLSASDNRIWTEDKSFNLVNP